MSSSGALSKASAQRHQHTLLELLRQPGNETCADCQSRNPRWASWNLGIFLCVKCAGVHRKLGTHISKVKSVTLDSWSKEQLQQMKNIGNLKSNQSYNPDQARFPPPADLEESERHSELEKYIRKKYQSRSFARSCGSVDTWEASSTRSADSRSPFSSSQSNLYPGAPLQGLPPGQSGSGPSRSVSANLHRSQAHLLNQAVDCAMNPGSYPITTNSDSLRPHSSTPDLPHPPALLRSSTAPIPNANLQHSPLAPPPFALPSHRNDGGSESESLRQKAYLHAPHATSEITHQLPCPNLDVQPLTFAVNQARHFPPEQVQKSGVWDDLMQLEDPSILSHQFQSMNFGSYQPIVGPSSGGGQGIWTPSLNANPAQAFNPSSISSANAHSSFIYHPGTAPPQSLATPSFQPATTPLSSNNPFNSAFTPGDHVGGASAGSFGNPFGSATQLPSLTGVPSPLCQLPPVQAYNQPSTQSLNPFVSQSHFNSSGVSNQNMIFEHGQRG